jgi:prephenate dehydrogenase
VLDRLAVVGVGLMGGSVARAARAHGLAREIVGVGRDAGRLRPALADGTLDRITTDPREAVRGADFVVLAAPVQANEHLLPIVWGAVPADSLVSDVGSTKQGIVQAARRLGAERPVAFVGSHPMAGSEESGYGAARADLFQGAAVIVTPTDGSPPSGVKSVVAFWEALGAARILTMDPESHDRAVAAVSHLPHLVACALVDGVERCDPAAFEVAARGFRDTTRIAAADPEVWQEIFVANRAALGASLHAFLAALEELAAAIEAGDVRALGAMLRRIKARREALR